MTRQRGDTAKRKRVVQRWLGHVAADFAFVALRQFVFVNDLYEAIGAIHLHTEDEAMRPATRRPSRRKFIDLWSDLRASKLDYCKWPITA